MQDLEISEADFEGIPMVKVAGEVDHATAPALKEAVLAQLPPPEGYLLIDLTHVTYIDSAGIQVFYATMEALLPEGWLGLLGPGPHTRRILEIAGLMDNAHCRIFLDSSSAAEAVRAALSTRREAGDAD